MNNRLSIIAACSVAALMGACASAPPASQPVYSNAPQYQQSQYAQYGQVNRIDVIPTASRTSGGGAVIGAVLGAVVGNQFGAGTGRALATGAGAVAGGVAGNAIEKRTKRDTEVFRVGVRLEDGSYREVDFQRIDDLQVGDRVKVENGQMYRV